MSGSDEKERPMNSDEALDAVEEEGSGVGTVRRDKRQSNARCVLCCPR